MTPLPPVRPRFYTAAEADRRGRHRDPAFRGTAPDARIVRRLVTAIRTARPDVADMLSSVAVRLAAGMSVGEAEAATEMERIGADRAEGRRLPN